MNEQYPTAKKLWIPDSEKWITATFGPKIAQQAEAKVYCRTGELNPANQSVLYR